MGRSTGGRTFAFLLFTTMFEVQATTNIALHGHWEILRDLCAAWSLRNVGLIYSWSFEHELRVNTALKEAAEKFGDMGVNINIHNPPKILDARNFTEVPLLAFIILSQDKSTLLYLQQISGYYPAVFDIFKWIMLVASNTDVSTLLQPLDKISYRSQFVVITVGRCGTCTAQLDEWYRVVAGGPLRRSYLGRWSRLGGLEISHEDIWQRRRDLEGLQLNVAIVESPPFVRATPSPHGYLLDVWRAMETALNFTSKFSVLHELTFAAQERRLVDPASNGNVDVLLRAIAANSVRRVAYLSGPVMKLRFRVYIHRPELNSFWQSFVTPFDVGVWSLTGFVLVTGSVMLAFSYSKSREMGADRGVEPALHRVQDAFLVTYGAMLQQGSEWIPRSSAARLVYWMSLTFGMLLYTAYSATLISSLTLQRRAYPFLSLEQLLQSQYSLCIVDQSATHTILQGARDSTVSALYREKIEKVFPSLVPDISAGLQRVSQIKTHAFLDVHERVHSYLGTLDCRLVDIPRDHFTTYGALGVREDLPYKLAIDYYLKRMSEGGLQKRLQWRYLWQHVRCEAESIKSIRLKNVGMVFLYLFLGLLVSFAVLVCERTLRTGGSGHILVRTRPDVRQRNLMTRDDRPFSLSYIE